MRISMKLRTLSALPNQEGFKFVGVTNSGVELKCIVKKDIKGIHYVGTELDDDSCYFKLVGWYKQ